MLWFVYANLNNKQLALVHIFVAILTSVLLFQEFNALIMGAV